MKSRSSTEKKIVKFEKFYEIDVIFNITQINLKNKKHKSSNFWIAYFSVDNEYLNCEIYCDSELIYADYSLDFCGETECNSEDFQTPNIYYSSLDWVNQQIGDVLNFEPVNNINEFLSALNIKPEFKTKKENEFEENSTESVNTRIFTLEELKLKKYVNLKYSLDIILEEAESIEYCIEELLELEKENGLTEENEKALNFLTTQLDYLFKNIQTIIKALQYHEDKVKYTINEFIIFNN